MPSCAVYGCNNYSKKTKGSNIKYFSFPKDSSLCKEWITVCKRKDKFNIHHARICSAHFSSDSFLIPLRQQLLHYTPINGRNLKPDAIPTENLPLLKEHHSTDRENRMKLKARRLLVNSILKEAENKENIEVDITAKKVIRLEEPDLCPGPTIIESGVNSEKLQEENLLLKERMKDLEIENGHLKSIKKKLEEENLNLRNEAQDLKKRLYDYFTPGQVQRILNPAKKQIRWGATDIAAAISLRAVSPKAYRYLRQNGLPLPALSTLRSWALSLNLTQGLLGDVLNLMKQKAKCFKEQERVTVLSFDEIYVSNEVCIDPINQQVVGPHRTCQVVFARGLFAQWKQPVFYMFDQPMKKEILLNIISELYNVGFTVVSITSDMGTTNQSLWSKLNVGYGKECFFCHPLDMTLKIFVFADAPHLLKLARNHLLDGGYNYNGKYINRSCLERLISASTDDLKIVHKVNRYHLDIRGSERQKVRPAAQLFSATTAKAIAWCGKTGFLENTNWQETSRIFKLFNDWFDIFNAKAKFGSHPGVNGFGVDQNNQEKVLKELSQFLTSMTVGKHFNMIPFQTGILLNNNSLVQLYNYLKSKYNTEYIITYRLNQDIVENFFSYIRGMGATNDHPTPLDFKYRLRWYILGKHSAAIFTMNRNTEENVNEACLVKPLQSSQIIDDDTVCLSQSLLKHVIEKCEQTNIGDDETFMETYMFVEPEPQEITPELENILKEFEDVTFSEIISNEGLKYLAGYIAYRFQTKYRNYNLGTATGKLDDSKAPDWIQFLSRGHLMYPSDELVRATQVLNNEFLSFHKNSLSKETMIFKKVADLTMSKLPVGVNIPLEVVVCLARTRTYIRLREINKKLSFENCKRKLRKKMSKFTNTRLKNNA